MALSGLINNSGSPITLKEAEGVLSSAVNASRQLHDYLDRFNNKENPKTRSKENSAKNTQKDK